MSDRIEQLPIDRVFPNPDQPRKHFDRAKLEELAGSITVSGLLQPITVVPRPQLDGDAWMIIAGERRWRACQIAGAAVIPAVVRDVDEKTVAELALIENLLRADLNLIEEAKGYQDFLVRGYTVESLAKLLGLNQSWRITERTNLLKLDPKFQDALSRAIITPSQAQEMSRLSIEGQFKLWSAIQSGQCDTYAKLRRLAGALLDAEQQQELFKREEQITERDRKALSAVDRFIEAAGRAVSLVADDDLRVLESVLKSDAPACVAKLDLLIGVSRKLRDALTTNIAKQEVSAQSATAA